MAKKIYVIVGATASGKSDLAVRLAQQINGCVVNADSMQIYRDVPTLTARPTEADTQGIAHYLYGMLDCHTTGSVTQWLDEAIPLLNTLDNPIVVGGTGLYIKALTEGLSPIPEVDPAVRAQVRLMPIEQVRAQIEAHMMIPHLTDPQRLRRALEVQLTTGKPITYFQKCPLIRKIEADFEVLWVNLPRPVLRQRCYDRFVKMLQRGAVDEVQALSALHPSGGVLKAIGVKEITAYLQGHLTYERMVDLAVTATRQYAKRQQTWFKNQLKKPQIIDNPLNFKL